MLLGAIADDFTGATDLATNLVARGYRTVVRTGLGGDPAVPADVDALVVALRSRTAPVEAAVADTRAALAQLRAAGCARVYLKYCSTFDSTPAGNIGPALDVLMTELAAPVTIAVPAFPAAGRTVYQGHLFVGEQLLSDSPMRHHPLTPMTDSDLVRLLAAQTRHPVVRTTLDRVRAGATALRDTLTADPGTPRIHVLDAIDESDLATIAAAAEPLPLWSGGSGLALGLPPGPATDAREIPVVPGHRVVLAGSASAATRRQVAAVADRMPSRRLDLAALRTDPAGTVDDLVTWAAAQWRQDTPVLIYAVGSLDHVEPARPGTEPASVLVERALAGCAVGLAGRGARQFLVAGGETSGAVTAALGVTALRIGPAVAPGVAWAAGTTAAGDPVDLALKSGNFGADDIFVTAWDRLR